MSMKILDIKTAASHIKQACDDSRQLKHRSPFFFLVGAGISHPPIPLACEIESECKAVAAKYIQTYLGQVNPAITAYSKALESGSKAALVGLGYLKLMAEQLEDAESNFLKASKLLPTATGPRFNLAIVYGLTGRKELADKLYVEVISLFPSNMRPSRVLRRITAQAGLRAYEQAKKDLSDLILKVPNLANTTHDFFDDLELMSRMPETQTDILRFRQDAMGILGLKG